MKECPICHTCFSDKSEVCNTDKSPLLDLIAGSPIIADKYRLDKKIGVGRIGIVFICFEEGIMKYALLFFLIACGQKNEDSQNSYNYIKIKNLTEKNIEELNQLDFIPEHGGSREIQLGYIKKFQFEKLSPELKSNIELTQEPEEDNEDEVEFIPEVQGYHNYEDVTEELRFYAEEYPNIVKLYSAGKSVEGRELWYVRISDHVHSNNTPEHEPKLLFISSMHGNETPGKEMMLYLIRELIYGYELEDEKIKNLVDHSEIFIMPLMNPDGNTAKRRFNANRIDLNRHFPDFMVDNHDSTAGREPEIQAIMKLHDQHNFTIALNFHSGEVCINIPWDTKDNGNPKEKFGDDFLLSHLARQYADLNPTMSKNMRFDRGVTYGHKWFEIHGGMQDWANYYRQSIHATVELTKRLWPSAFYLGNVWKENRNAMYMYLNSGLMGYHLRVTDSKNRVLPQVDVSVSNSTRTISYFHEAYIHRVTLAGEHQIVISAPGYESQAFQFEAEKFNGLFRQVVLKKK